MPAASVETEVSAQEKLIAAVENDTKEDAIAYFESRFGQPAYGMVSPSTCAVASYFSSRVGSRVYCDRRGINLEYTDYRNPPTEVKFPVRHWAVKLQLVGVPMIHCTPEQAVDILRSI